MRLEFRHPLLVDNPAEHHQGHVARLGVGDAEPLVELGPDPQPLERFGQELAATVDYHNRMSGAAQGGNLPGDALAHHGVLLRLPADLDHQLHACLRRQARPVSSRRPNIKFMF